MIRTTLAAAVFLGCIAATAAAADTAPAPAEAAPAAAIGTPAVSPACPAPLQTPAAATPASPLAGADFLAADGPCTVTRDCDCTDVTISCSSPGGTCSSGPGTCGGWVECDGVRTWCPPDPGPPPCTTVQCSSKKKCDIYCAPWPGFCTSYGCCICA